MFILSLAFALSLETLLTSMRNISEVVQYFNSRGLNRFFLQIVQKVCKTYVFVISYIWHPFA